MRALVYLVTIVLVTPMLMTFLAWSLVFGSVMQLTTYIPGVETLYQKIGLREDTSKMAVDPLRVIWAGESKAVVMKVTNQSGEAWGRFAITCYGRGWSTERMTDMSGILPGQTVTRTYALSDNTITSVTDCKLAMHMRGKPTQYDEYAAHDRGDGGWGDRLPGDPMSDPVTDSYDGASALDGGPEDGVDTSKSYGEMGDRMAEEEVRY